MSQLFTNAARTTLFAPIDNTQLTMQVTSAGSFPAVTAPDFCYVTLYRGAVGAETDVEIVKVTNTSATTFTIERGQEGTTAQNYVALGGTINVDLRLTAAGATAMMQKANNLSDVASASTARTNLGLAIGTNVQAWDTDLDWVATNISTAGKALLDDADDSAQRTTLGLGNSATLNTGTTAGTVATGDHTHAALYQPVDATLTALAGVTISDNVILRGTGVDAFETKLLSDFGATLIDDADASGARSTLGLGTIATLAAPAGTVVGTTDTQTLTNKTISLGSNTVSGTQAQFDTACTDGNFLYTDDIGVSVQAYDADLTTWAGVTPGTGVTTFLATPTSANLAAAVTDETGTGALVFATSPTLVSPALGTPASGVVTNLTGTASININGTVGATTPAAGTFTTLTSTGNAALGDAEATDTHAIKGVTTVLANSANAALTITQTGSGNAFVVEDSASTDATPFVIDANGKVIVGNTLNINNNLLQVAATTGDSISALRFSAGAAAPDISLVKSRGATVGTNTLVLNNDPLGNLLFKGADGTGYITAAQIRAEVDGTPGTNDMPGRLVFSTTPDGSATPVEAVRIDSAQQTKFSANNTTSAVTITQTGTGNAFVVEDSTSTDATPFVVDATGRVVVGHTTSIGMGQTTNIQSHATSGAAGMSAVRWSADSVPPRLQLGKSRSATVGAYSIVLPNDQLGGVYFYGDDGTDLVSQGASIIAEVDGTPGTNDMPGRLVFSTTADGASTPTEAMRIDSAGLVTLAAGQIKFPATQNASSDANTLDDYEEGTWTPVYEATTGAFGAITYDLQTGRYVKIGRQVFVAFILRTDAFAIGTGSGSVRVGGLPFTAASGSVSNVGSGLGYSAAFTTNAPSSAFLSGAAATFNLYYRATANGDSASLPVADMKNAANSNYICGSLSYEV